MVQLYFVKEIVMQEKFETIETHPLLEHVTDHHLIRYLNGLEQRLRLLELSNIDETTYRQISATGAHKI